MKFKIFSTIIFLILGLQYGVSAQNRNELFTIYLVRHAEKNMTADNYSDPPLTPCGQQRAKSLDSFLEDVNLDAVYSTDYDRTRSTALPTALTKELEIKLYNSNELEDFSKLLNDCKQDALVVGHSFSTGVLAGLLTDQELEAFDLSIYNRIYQVVFYKNTGRLHLLHTAFDCED
jgi:phosphohistidine phosphatase SixA